MRANVTRLWLAIGALGVMSGCSSCGAPECEDLFVTFDSPKDGATGVPATTDVKVRVANGAGNAIELDSATLVSRSTSATEFSVPRDGTISSGQAAFTGVTLEPGPNLIKVTVKKKGTSCTGTKSVTVEVPVSSEPPRVLTFSYPQDTVMPTGTLNSVELPPATPLRIDLTTQFAIGGTVEIIDSATGTTLGSTPTPLTSSAVTVAVPPANVSTDKAYSLFAKITNGTRVNTVALNPMAVKVIALDRTAPTCAVTAPTVVTLGPKDDADTVKAMYQLRAVGSTSAEATTLELRLTGGATPQTTGPLAPTNLIVSKDFDVPATGTVAYTVAAEAKDSAGNTCVATRLVTVDFDPPTLSIVSPDGGTETTFNIPIIANVMGGNGGTVEWKVTDALGTRNLGILSVDAGVSAGVGSFVNGMATISATPTDAVGNTGMAATRPFTVAATSGCSVVFNRPATRPGFITVGQISAGNYSFQAATSCSNGTMIALKRNGTTIASSSVGGGAVIWNVPVTSGTFRFRAEVGTAPFVFDEMDVIIDLTAPAITQPFDGATINLAADAAPGTAGIQRALVYSATIPTGGRADVCSNQVPAATGSTACADGASGWWTLRANVSTPDATFTFPDGSYCLKLVVVSGATTNVSLPTCLVVDGLAPTVTGITLLRDANADLKLNLSELNSLAPEFQFTLGAGHAQSSISSVQVKEGGTNFNTTASVTYSGAMLNVVNVKLDQNVTSTTQTYAWVIDVTDTAGNVGSSPVQMVKIDKVAPTCAITAPNATELGRPDDANMATPAFDLKVDVSGSADTAVVAIGTTGGQTLMAMVNPTTGTATNTFALSQTSGVLTYNLTATCRDDSGNSSAATPVAGLSVDLDPPTCTMTAPAASPPQYSTLSIPTSVTVGGPATIGRTVTIFSQVGAAARQQIGSLTVASSGIAAGNVSYNNGPQTVTAEVSDPAGNLCTVPGRTIDINSAQCAIAFTSPVIGASGKAYLTSTTFSVTGVSSNCGAGKQVQLFLVGNAVPLGTGTTASGGTVTIAGMLAEGGPYTLRLRIDNGAGLTTDTDLVPVHVDATAPVATSVQFNTVTYPAMGMGLSFVALDNRNLLPPTPNATFVADNTVGGDAEFNVKVNGVTGAIGGRVRVVYQGERASVDVAASPQDVTLNGVILAHNTTGTFQIEVIDEAGNVLRPISVPAVVDVREPGMPAVTRGLVAARPATVSLNWMPTYDDGAVAGSGPHQGYEIRWSTSTVLNNNLLSTPTDYHDSTKARPESNQPWSSSVVNRNLTLPPNNTYYVAVRAVDEVGNYSPYAAPTPLANLGTTDILTNPSGASDLYAFFMASRGSLNNDAVDDLVVSAFSAARVYVYFGGTGFAAQSTCPTATCQRLDIPVPKNPATESFGNSVVVGKVSNASTSELAVGSANFNASQGRAFLYFGGANPDAGTHIDNSIWVEFRGSAASDFGRHVAVLPDMNGDGLGELAVTARNQNANRGRMFIFKGRSKAAWIAAAGGTFIADSAADWIVEGPTPVLGTSNNFGSQASISSVGPLNGGPGNDFTVSAAHETVNEVYLVSAAKLLDAGTLTTGRADAGTANLAFQTISRPQIGNAVFAGFGGAVVGEIDVTGAVAKDLVISNRKEQSLFIYGDGTPSSFGNPLITVVGGVNFGSVMVASDLNGDGRPDLVSSELSGSGVPANVWVLYNRANGFDPLVGQFFQSVFTATSGPSGGIGTSLAVGDFNADGSIDLAVADRSTGFGRVLVWR